MFPIDYFAPLIKDIMAKVEFLRKQGIPCQFTITHAQHAELEKMYGPKWMKQSAASADSK